MITSNGFCIPATFIPYVLGHVHTFGTLKETATAIKMKMCGYGDFLYAVGSSFLSMENEVAVKTMEFNSKVESLIAETKRIASEQVWRFDRSNKKCYY